MVNRCLFSLLLSCCLVACSSGTTFAPVSDIATIQPIPPSGKQRLVHRGSLYEIAWQYGLDYRELAKRNHRHSPFVVKPGEQIYLKGHAPKPIAYKPAPQKPKRVHPDPVMAKKWIWPARGKVIGKYAGLNKGINISGGFGSPIHAANAGKVVYSGNGLRGYGNLIIIKHNATYMSAYAHNSAMLVKEGDSVRQGQKIAEMGSSGTNTVMLHFEIRYNGLPVNPTKLLKS